VSIVSIVLIIIGVALLVFGSDFLVKGASKLATAAGVSSLVIGLTVVAYGTSAPEMAVSTMAAVEGSADIAVGNVVGSNIFNVLIILGLSALIVPLTVHRQLIRLDVPLMIAVSFVLLIMGVDGNIGKIDGILLFGGAVAYTIGLIRMSRRETKAAAGDEVKEKVPAVEMVKSVLLVVIGLVLLVGGSKLLVKGAIDIAIALGVSELVIGLTIVAAGTSMPELATSIMAAIRGERDIAIGNVVGSNIFNILAVLGISGIISPNAIPFAASVMSTDIPIMIIAALLCFPFFITGFKLDRIEAVLFLGMYGAYTALLIGTAQSLSFAEPLRLGIFIGSGLIFAIATIYGIATMRKNKNLLLD